MLCSFCTQQHQTGKKVYVSPLLPKPSPEFHSWDCQKKAEASYRERQKSRAQSFELRREPRVIRRAQWAHTHR